MDEFMGKEVYFKKYELTEIEPGKYGKDWVDHKGKFIQFGVNYEELDGGAVTYTAAVILTDDGKFHIVPIEYVKLIKKDYDETTTKNFY